MISKTKAIAVLEDLKGDCTGIIAATIEDCQKVIGEMAEESGWISVTEWLPEDYLPKDSKVKQIKVLVAYKTNGRWVERTQIRVKGYYYGAPDKWSWVKTSDPISHWMPLPEPPKEPAHDE